MNPQFLILIVGVIAGGWIVMSDMNDTETAPQKPTVRITAGGAKFVKNGTGQTRTGSQQQPKQTSGGVVNLMAPKAPQTNGLGLSDLKARQRNEAKGFITQRNGSASLPRHNDVPRMNGMVKDF
ncbi:hypothetical protein ACXYMO_11395 [Arenibacterium sp. CAU 1754]